VRSATSHHRLSTTWVNPIQGAPMHPCLACLRCYAHSPDGLIHVFHHAPYCETSQNPPILLLSRHKPLLTDDELIFMSPRASPDSFRFQSMIPLICTRAFVLQLTLAHCSCRHVLACRLQGPGSHPWLRQPPCEGRFTTPVQASDATTIPCLRAMMGDALAPAAEFAWTVLPHGRRSKP